MKKMIEVRNREEAWREADRLFPTDYMKDDHSSANAGYPIFESTADGNGSWISDLGNRLELNIVKDNGKKIETINIWIVEEPEILEEVKWSASSVRRACIKGSLYTCGDCRAYDKMLNMVDECDPTLSNIYKVAKDIADHSDEENTIESIMFLLNAEAIDRFYTVK